jgi:hypothetical protein
MISWPSSGRRSKPASPPPPRRQPAGDGPWRLGRHRSGDMCCDVAGAQTAGITTTTRPHRCWAIIVSAWLRSWLEAASSPAASRSLPHLSRSTPFLARFLVAGVVPVPTDRIVPVIAQTLSHLPPRSLERRPSQRFQPLARDRSTPPVRRSSRRRGPFRARRRRSNPHRYSPTRCR